MMSVFESSIEAVRGHSTRIAPLLDLNRAIDVAILSGTSPTTILSAALFLVSFRQFSRIVDLAL